MSDDETNNIRNSKAATNVRRHVRARTRVSPSRRNNVDQDQCRTRDPKRARSTCARFVNCFQKFTPKDIQVFRYIKSFAQLCPWTSWGRRVADENQDHRVKYRRAKSKRQLQRQPSNVKRKVVGTNLQESYHRLSPFLDLDQNQNVVQVQSSEKSADSGMNSGDCNWQQNLEATAKHSVPTMSCEALLEPSEDSETDHDRESPSSDMTRHYSPPLPAPLKDRKVTTPPSLPIIPRPASASKLAFRSFVDICPRRLSNSDFNLNKISKPHKTPNKSRIPPPIPPWRDEPQIIPVFHANQRKERELQIRPPAIRPIPVNPTFSKRRSYRLHGSEETSNLTLNPRDKKPSKILHVPEPEHGSKSSLKKQSSERMHHVPKVVSFETIRKPPPPPPPPQLAPVKSVTKHQPKKLGNTQLQDGLLAGQLRMSNATKSVLEKVRISDEIKESSAIVAKWGKVNSLYIPSNSSKPSLKGPSFLKYSSNINWNAIELRHARAELTKNRLSEEKEAQCQKRQNDWEQRRRIALYKNRLQNEQCVPNIKIHGQLESRFHHIHSFTSGHGSTNQVGRYFDTVEGKLVAIKIYGSTFPGNISERLRSKLAAFSEITALAKMTNCYNIVQIITYFELDGRLHLILECCDHSLRSEIEKARKGLHPKMAQRITGQIINALAYCHIQKCLHCDISPENLLVTKAGIIKLADFDKSIFLTEDKRPDTLPGTITYGAPELLMKRCNYGLSADIWSVGCVLAELLKGSPLWNYNTAEEQLLHILDSFTPSFPEYPQMVNCSRIIQRGPEKSLREMLPSASEDAMSFVSKCLNIDSEKRSACAELLQHEYLKPTWETPENPFGWNSMAAAILPLTEINHRSHSAPTTVVTDTGFEETDYEHDRHFEFESGTEPVSDDGSMNTAVKTDANTIIAGFHSSSTNINPSIDPGTCDTDATYTISHCNAAAVDENDRTVRKPRVAFKLEKSDSDPSLDSNGNPTDRKAKRRRKKRCKRAQSDTSSCRLSSRDPPRDRDLSDTDAKVKTRVKLKKQRPESNSARPRMPLPLRQQAANRQVSYESTLKKNARDVPKRYGEDASQKPMFESTRVQNSSMTNLAKLSSSQICALAQNPAGSPKGPFPVNNKGILTHIIAIIPELTGEDAVNQVCSHLNKIINTAPKMFGNHVNVLVVALLEQVSQTKTKHSCPAVKILETLYEITPKSLNSLAERIMDCIMTKFGGPSFIENPCFNIMEKIGENINPSRFCSHLTKIGPGQRLGLGRAVAAKFLCDGVRKLSLDEDLGDTTRAQRSFTRAIFDAATKFIRDPHIPARDYGKELYCILIQHVNFWHLYLNLVPDSERPRVNKLLDEIRNRITTSEGKA